ncbi:MAG: hypothetical protein L6Q75_19600 [Burkholderiaceae bacterium]|nr:hypothetical protein [Burkholderiaceae bacterium]
MSTTTTTADHRAPQIVVRQHQLPDVQPELAHRDHAIPATSAAAQAYAHGERCAVEYLLRCARGLAKPGELHARLVLLEGPALTGFLDRLQAHAVATLKGSER